MVLVLLEQKCAFMLLGFPDEDELTVQLEAYLNLYQNLCFSKTKEAFKTKPQLLL
jgi:hypothetical protein